MNTEFKTKSIDAAYALTGRTNFEMPPIPGLPDEDRNYMKDHFDWTVVVEAINTEANDGKKWEPDFTNANERKYEGWVWVEPSDTDPSGWVFSRTASDWTNASATFGSRLCYVSREAWYYTIETFPDLFKKVFLKKRKTE